MTTLTTRIAPALLLALFLHCGSDDTESWILVEDAAESDPAPATSTGSLEQTAKPKPPFPTGEVFVPDGLFNQRTAIGRRVLAANPRLYLYDDFDPDAEHILVVGMPGWGGRSENYIWILINGLKQEGLTHRLIIASVQDLGNGGPTYQGQGTRAHANTWIVGPDCVEGMRHFVSKVAGPLGGDLEVYLHGFSTGGVSAPVLATKVAQGASGQEGYTMAGAIAMGTESRVSATLLKELHQRVLFVVVPKRMPKDWKRKVMRDDQWNRMKAEKALDRLVKAGAEAHLRHVVSARRHVDWHWGLVSQCRYFRSSRLDDGRGYWPNYWKPNPETMGYITAFILGEEPPAEGTSRTITRCPY